MVVLATANIWCVVMVVVARILAISVAAVSVVAGVVVMLAAIVVCSLGSRQGVATSSNTCCG